MSNTSKLLIGSLVALNLVLLGLLITREEPTLYVPYEHPQLGRMIVVTAEYVTEIGGVTKGMFHVPFKYAVMDPSMTVEIGDKIRDNLQQQLFPLLAVRRDSSQITSESWWFDGESGMYMLRVYFEIHRRDTPIN